MAFASPDLAMREFRMRDRNLETLCCEAARRISWVERSTLITLRSKLGVVPAMTRWDEVLGGHVREEKAAIGGRRH